MVASPLLITNLQPQEAELTFEVENEKYEVRESRVRSML